MPSLPVKALVSRFRNASPLEKIIGALWCIVFLVIFIRAARCPGQNTVLDTYMMAGRHWLEGKAVYSGRNGFVYSPLIAAFFAPLAMVPKIYAEIFSRLLYGAVYLGALAWWLRAGFQRAIPANRQPLVFLLLLPFTIGNINNAQVNPLLAGLMMLSLLAVHSERWMLAAFCSALAVYLKIYPVVVGMLLIAVAPRRFTWRWVVALIALGALSFALQSPAYVLDQYRMWIHTRFSDNRHLYEGAIIPHDLWLLLRMAHISISENAYLGLQVLSGAAIGAVCVLGRVRRWSSERLFATMLSLVCSWMLLCGPASESATYVILAPAVALALVSAYCRPLPFAMRALITSATVLLLAALGVNSFLDMRNNLTAKAIQPLGALLFCAYSYLLAARSSWWSEVEAREENRSRHSLLP